MALQPSTVDLSSIGPHLLRLREQADVKQLDLAKSLSLSAPVISRIESGERVPTLDEAEAILGQLGTPQAAQAARALRRGWEVLEVPPLDHPDQDSLWDAEQTAIQLRGLCQAPDTPPALVNRLTEYVDELKRCSAVLLNRSYQVAVIGAIGVGKSSAICHLTGLLASKEDGASQPVFETGGGRTTVCEVHLRQGHAYGVLVEPRSTEEVLQDVNDFADQFYRDSSVTDDDGARGSKTGSVSIELERAIRNLAGLAPTSTRGADNKRVTTDPAKALAAQLPSSREFAMEVMSRMALHTRGRREIWFETIGGKAPYAKLRDLFRAVNNGQHPEFGLPRSIEVVVKEAPLEADGLSVRFIDTKGIDGTAAREDLEIHLKEAHTLAVVCSSFNDAPGLYAQELFDRALKSGVRGIAVNACVLVLPKHDEALAMKDDATSMAVESAAEGYEVKEAQAALVLEQMGLPGVRVGFYDCMKDPAAHARQFVTEGLAKVRAEQVRQLLRTSEDAQSLVSSHREASVRDALEKAARRLQEWVSCNGTLPAIPGHVQDSLIEQIKTVHPAIVYAAARRDGEWVKLSYSYQIGYGARCLAVSAVGRVVDGFVQYCRVMSANPDFEGAKELVSQAERVLLAGFDELQRKLQLMGQAVYRDALKADPTLLQRCVDEWGRTRGYRQRVTQYNQEWFDDGARTKLEAELRGLVEREWTRVLQGLSALVATDQ